MYQNGFVASIKINDRTVEEKDSKVVMPFDTEFSIMLKNRNDRKAVARIYIDGEEITKKGRVIIDANSSVDIERYLDESLENGKKFKFVKLSNEKVTDKHDSEKGFIEVRFQLIKAVLNNVIYHTEHVYHRRNHWLNDLDWHPFYYSTSPVTFNTNTSGGKGSICNYSCSSSPVVSTNHDAYLQGNHIVEEKGATIKGSDSSQKFSYSYVGELEQNETVIRMNLVGTENKEVASQYVILHCVKCGKAFDKNDNFCAKCGNKR